MRTAKLLAAAATIFLVMAAGGEYVPARPDIGPRGDFEPAGHFSAPAPSLFAPEPWQFNVV
jgi:hypothetical protein